MYNANTKNKIKDGSTIVRVILIVALVIAVLLSVYPFIYMFLISLMETHTMNLTIEKILSAKLTFDNYVRAFTRGNYLVYLRNSAIVTLYAVTVTCLVSAMSAYAFAKKKFPGKNGLFLAYLATMMIPSQVTLIPCFLILKTLGMLNTFSGMALPTCTAFGTLLIHSFMLSVPDDLLEAADIDGCGEVKKFVRIVLPLIKPVLISLAIFTFINVWGALLLPMIVISKNEMLTLPVAIASLRNPIELTDYGLIMATSTISFLPPFILYLFLQKQFVEGIALSGTKM